jgi:hypothetical protein
MFIVHLKITIRLMNKEKNSVNSPSFVHVLMILSYFKTHRYLHWFLYEVEAIVYPTRWNKDLTPIASSPEIMLDIVHD